MCYHLTQIGLKIMLGLVPSLSRLKKVWSNGIDLDSNNNRWRNLSKNYHPRSYLSLQYVHRRKAMMNDEDMTN